MGTCFGIVNVAPFGQVASTLHRCGSVAVVAAPAGGMDLLWDMVSWLHHHFRKGKPTRAEVKVLVMNMVISSAIDSGACLVDCHCLPTTHSSVSGKFGLGAVFMSYGAQKPHDTGIGRRFPQQRVPATTVRAINLTSFDGYRLH